MADLSAQSVPVPRPARPGARAWWTPSMTIQAGVLAGLVAILYWPVLYRLVYIWRNNGDWSHGFLIPVFGLYYLYLQRHRMPRGLRESGLFPRIVGALLVCAGFLLYVYCITRKIEYPKGAAMVVTILGVVLLTCGWLWTRWGWFAVAFLLFASPLPQRLYVQLTRPLQRIAAEVSSAALTVMIPGLDLEVRNVAVDFYYEDRSGQINVEQACSGMKSLMAISSLGVAMAFLSGRPLWHRMVMILSCLPIAILCNMIRVTATGAFVVLGRDDLASGTPHMLLGLVTFGLALLLYLGVGYVLSHLFEEHQPPAKEGERGMAAGGMSE